MSFVASLLLNLFVENILFKLAVKIKWDYIIAWCPHQVNSGLMVITSIIIIFTHNTFRIVIDINGCVKGSKYFSTKSLGCGNQKLTH